jgi:hypothetical protein
MEEADALDENKWNLGDHRTDNGKHYSVNLQSTLFVGLTAMDARLFRKLDKSGLTIDPDRCALLRALVETIDSWNLSPQSICDHGRALKRFVRWADERTRTLSRATIVPLLANYRDAAADRGAAVRRAAAAALDLTADEQSRLFPADVPIQSANDDWVIKLDTPGGARTADFLRFVVSGNASLRSSAFAKVRSALQMDAVDDRSGRAELVRRLCKVFKEWTTAKSYAPITLVNVYGQLAYWIVWADEQGLPLDTDSALETLVSYSQHRTRQWRAGALSVTTVRMMLRLPAYLLAAALGRQPYEIVYRLSLHSSKNSGLTSARPNQATLKSFCASVNAIVIALPSEILCAPIHAPIQVTLWSGSESRNANLPDPYGGYGDQVIAPRLANLPLTSIRIWAEMHRFIAVTGCNPSDAQCLTIGDWIANGPLLVSLKKRATKFVSVRVGRQYERHIEAHIAFLKAAFPVPIRDDAPLFPGIRFFQRGPGKRTLVAYLRAGLITPRPVTFDPSRDKGTYRWARTNGLKLTARQLRRAKATWLLRRYSGDPLRVAQALGNTPGVVHGHYGGKGNLEQAIPEWSRHWASTQAQAALAPGKCESPGRYEPINDQASTPGTCNEGGCLSCWHYRGEESLDYIHRMLSYRHCLCFRASSNAEVVRQIVVIDQILEAYLERNADHREAVHQLQARISDRPHRRFAAMIHLMEAIYGH